MSYFKVLGFEKEPFSTSPDPDFFYLSKEHEAALANILIELRLKRGLSVILGDVGTGKTTLSRKLIQELKDRPDFIFHIILDPSFESEEPIMAQAPNFVELEITYSEPAVKGDTSSGALKNATTENGVEIKVPLFVNQGDKIKVDTRTGEYVSRVKE